MVDAIVSFGVEKLWELYRLGHNKANVSREKSWLEGAAYFSQ
ncbi:unnamed protein product [Arabidopsis arenosa]|uniref:Uncharacterized protein n=1 Tax=Arabidopsis arenosa TaxID=38785 RepID=A0A8S2AR17_ARAAE|nr:unnamed protein product [Arabidopsis arenosa]